MSISDQENKLSNRLIYFYPLLISLFFLAAAPIAVVYTGEWDFFENLLHILTSPSKLVTDYFALGGLVSTLYNAAVCGLIANFFVFIMSAFFTAFSADPDDPGRRRGRGSLGRFHA